MSESFLPSATLEALRQRSDLLRRLRRFFYDRDFVEVETPLLSADTVVDLYLDPLRSTLFNDPRDPACGQDFFLQTSPEFSMKRLLAAGATAIFQVTRAFRGGEVGVLHNPEFTIVEWYRSGDDLRRGIDLLDELTQSLLGMPPAERLAYQAAFVRELKVDPLEATCAELVKIANDHNLDTTGFEDDRDTMLNLLLTERIEPKLGTNRPTILYNYPISQAALACSSDLDNRVAERFELYVDGIELANGYHELLDADELRRRNLATNAQRVGQGKPALPNESRLLAAMRSGLPPCSGVALGFDRFAMVASGANSLREVMAFPIDLA